MAQHRRKGKTDEEPRGNTPMRGLRISDAVWTAAADRARAEGTNLTALVVAFLTDYGTTTRPTTKGVSKGRV